MKYKPLKNKPINNICRTAPAVCWQPALETTGQHCKQSTSPSFPPPVPLSWILTPENHFFYINFLLQLTSEANTAFLFLADFKGDKISCLFQILNVKCKLK